MASGTLVGLALIQAVLAFLFVKLFYRRDRGPVVADADLPAAAILISLRGADLYLAQ